MKKKHIAILGSTGSIGTQTLNVIRRHRDLFEPEILVAGSNAELLIAQALEFHPNIVVIADTTKYAQVRDALDGTDTKVFAGAASVADVVTMDCVDTVMAAMVGFAGLVPHSAPSKPAKRWRWPTKKPSSSPVRSSPARRANTGCR